MPYKPQYKQYHINHIIADTLKIADMPFPSRWNPACKRCVRYFYEREPLLLSDMLYWWHCYRTRWFCRAFSLSNAGVVAGGVWQAKRPTVGV